MEIQPGIKIQCNQRTGTLGIIVSKENNDSKLYLLSCWHILDDGIEAGDVVLPDDNNRLIARYERSVDTANESLDASIAEIDSDIDIPINNRISGTDRSISSFSYSWKKNTELRKTGDQTGTTRCLIGRKMTQYGNLDQALKLKRHPNGRATYCAHGDSGSIWCTIEHGFAVGLHARGGLPGNFAAATPIALILRDMGLKIY